MDDSSSLPLMAQQSPEDEIAQAKAGSRADEEARLREIAAQPSPLKGLTDIGSTLGTYGVQKVSEWPQRAVSDVTSAVAEPAESAYHAGRQMLGQEPYDRDANIRHALNIAGAMTLGAGAGEAPAGALSAGLKRPKYMAVHSMESSRLPDVAELGGHANPSIAILNPQARGLNFFKSERPQSGMGFYGDVHLVAPKELIDPAKTPVFEGDAWTTLHPPIEENRTIFHEGKNKYIPATPKNVSDVMNYHSLPSNRTAEDIFGYGSEEDPFSYLSSEITPRFKNMKQMLQGRDNPAKASRINNEKEFNKLLASILPEEENLTVDNPNVAQLVESLVTGKYPKTYSPKIRNKIESFRYIMETPSRNAVPGSHYFEAKPSRAVMPDEWAGALLPGKLERKSAPYLERLGIPYKTYSPAEESTNKALIRHFGDYMFANGGKIPRKTWEPIHGLKITPPAEELSSEPDIRDYQLARQKHEFEGGPEPTAPRRPVVLDAPLLGGKYELGTLPYSYAPAVQKALNFAYGQKTLPLYSHPITAPVGRALDAYETAKFIQRDPTNIMNYAGAPGTLYGANKIAAPFIGAGAGAGAVVAEDRPEEMHDDIRNALRLAQDMPESWKNKKLPEMKDVEPSLERAFGGGVYSGDMAAIGLAEGGSVDANAEAEQLLAHMDHNYPDLAIQSGDEYGFTPEENELMENLHSYMLREQHSLGGYAEESAELPGEDAGHKAWQTDSDRLKDQMQRVQEDKDAYDYKSGGKVNTVIDRDPDWRMGLEDGGTAPYGVIDMGDKIILGSPHGEKIDLPEDIRNRVQDLAKQHGAYYEGNAGDVEANKDLIPEYRGSWDAAHGSKIKGYPVEYLAPMFSNVGVNRQNEIFADPEKSIMASIIANQDKAKYFEDRRFDEKALRDFLQQGSEEGADLLKMAQNRATPENLKRFFSKGESLMWPENWQEYPHKLGKIAKRFEDARNQYLLDAPPGVYVAGAGHIPELRRLKKDLKVIGGERAGYSDGGLTNALHHAKSGDYPLHQAIARTGYEDGGSPQADFEVQGEVRPLREGHYPEASGVLAALPVDNAQQLDVGPHQQSMQQANPEKIFDTAQNETIRQVAKNWYESRGANAPEPTAEDWERGYQLSGVKSPMNVMQNIPAEGHSSVVDPEGRKGNPLYVAGTTPAGRNVGLSPGQITDLSTRLARVYKYFEPEGDTHGATFANREQKLPFGMSNNALGINRSITRGEQMPSTLAHETGHVIHNYLGRGNAPLVKVPPAASQELSKAAEERWKHNYGSNPEDKIYTMKPQEMFAESIKNYMTDPANFKRFNPETAKYLRSIINTDPRINKLLFLSQLQNKQTAADGGVIDDAVRLAKGGGAWTRKEGQNPEGGLNAKGRAAAKAEGHNLKPPAPHPKTDKDAARRKSFCARMSGMKKKLTSSETAHDPDSRINKSLKIWNC